MENKFIFGAYANMASNNFSSCIRTIAYKHIINIKKNNNIEQLIGLLFEDKTNIQNIEAVFCDKFPWLKPLLERKENKDLDSHKMGKLIKEYLLKFYKQLNNIRNFHTHYYYDKLDIVNIDIENQGSKPIYNRL